SHETFTRSSPRPKVLRGILELAEPSPAVRRTHRCFLCQGAHRGQRPPVPRPEGVVASTRSPGGCSSASPTRRNRERAASRFPCPDSNKDACLRAERHVAVSLYRQTFRPRVRFRSSRPSSAGPLYVHVAVAVNMKP